jgi:hypothetical protein
VQRIGDGRTCRLLNGRMIERSDNAMCGLHRAHGDEEREFLGWASKPRSKVCQWFCLKTTWTVSLGLASKSVARVFRFGPQNRQLRFGDMDLKTKQALVYRLRHKTDGTMKTMQGTRRDLAVCFAWKQVGLEFFSLPQNWRRRDGGRCMWHHPGGRVRIKLKTGWLMR